MDICEIMDKIKEELDEKDKRREEVFAKARKIRRISSKAIREIHKKNYKSSKNLIKDAKEIISKFERSDMEFGFVQEALQEYAEAVLVHALLEKEEIPSPSQLGIPLEAYLLGLADSIGEIRRYVLDAIRKGELEEIEYFLGLMDDLSHEIMALDYPQAVIPIRKKQDMTRIVLEKTRGDVTLALRQAKLEKKLEKVK